MAQSVPTAYTVLYQSLYNKVEYELALLTAKTDDYWWAGIVAAPVGFAINPIIGAGVLLTSPAVVYSGTLAKWATDAPDDVAEVTIPGFTTAPVQTDASGAFLIEGVPRGNILIHTQKFFPDPAPGELREGDACYVPDNLNDPTSQGLRLVDCADLTHFLDTVVHTEVQVVLQDFQGVRCSTPTNAASAHGSGPALRR
jgi:hypothetical protein